jgi:hypothetical protein
MVNAVRAKFVCESVSRQRHRYGEQTTVRLRPVVDGSAENKGFWNATPGGTCELDIVNEAAAVFFEPRKEYYLDFTPAEG